jgi:hypothetical protein
MEEEDNTVQNSPQKRLADINQAAQTLNVRKR